MWFMSNKFRILLSFVLTATYGIAKCDPISNKNFNSNIRDYAATDVNNITNVKTLQKEDLVKYATFTPASNPIKFKEIPDSALSSSSNGRGLLYHDHSGYTVNEYEEGPHYTHGHDYHLYDPHSDGHGPPSFDHDYHGYHHNDHHGHHDSHDHHDYHDSHGHGHHHGHYDKHYKHALATKAVLWPIAGIALLGAAAALVSNPVLLQLGVISGKRRRRDTDEITGPDYASDMFTKYEEKIKELSNDGKNFQIKENLREKTKENRVLKIASFTETAKRRQLKFNNPKDMKTNTSFKKVHYQVKRNTNQEPETPIYDDNDNRFIPIPIKFKTSNGTD
ncbi:unnamed protein product [Spodoptera littoralis]|uniref:Cuticular protein n=1 Tax=Spodoptera littoralis TaxID=7109 RepID=A0A9P0HX07_SPOLI|nr:unnamed protein product [Spodoptera littoralis]CAH1636950.1 unnamed protein product [Spodoptera littoralis]